MVSAQPWVRGKRSFPSTSKFLERRAGAFVARNWEGWICYHVKASVKGLFGSLVIGEMSCKMAQDIARQSHAPGNATCFSNPMVACAQLQRKLEMLVGAVWRMGYRRQIMAKHIPAILFVAENIAAWWLELGWLAPTDLSFKLMNYLDLPGDMKGWAPRRFTLRCNRKKDSTQQLATWQGRWVTYTGCWLAMKICNQVRKW